MKFPNQPNFGRNILQSVVSGLVWALPIFLYFLFFSASRRLDSLYWAERTHEIVKYPPEGYDDNGVYCREEYLEVENRYVECAVEIVETSQCKYMTIGYVEDYQNKGYRYKDRINGEQLRDVLRAILRNETWCVLVNLKHKVQIDFGWDYYMDVICPLEETRLRRIVESHNLYLNPRSNAKRI